MPDRSAPIVVTPRACPFVALDGDRDRRMDSPDPLHRCFAETIPRARSISHQAEFCLTASFPSCPIFQDWASRAAAAPVTPRLPVPATIERSGTAAVLTPATEDPGTVVSPGSADEGDPDEVRLAAVARASEILDDVDAAATRPVPSYRAVSPTGAVVSATAGTIDTTGSERGASASDPTDGHAIAPVDDVPVIRSIPAPRSGAATNPVADEDWMAPPPWLRQPTGPVWIPEAVPPPDALADVGTLAVRRARTTEPLPDVVTEAAIPAGVEPVLGITGSFGEDTTGMPPDAALGIPGTTSRTPVSHVPATPARIIEASGTGTGTQPTDPGVSAELAASRYRADVAAGIESDDEPLSGSRSTAAPRRVPLDAQASAWLGSQAQPRPSARSTGSREWEGPRRFEAYAATQRRRPPTSVLVGGAAIAFAVLLLAVFLLPGALMGGGPASTVTPAPTELTAAITATQAPERATQAPDATARPEKTPRRKTYTVKSGDTLTRIAKRFKVRVDALTCYNRIRNPNNVAVGRTLTIPPKAYRCDD
jgi:hypothetical protein